MHFIIHIILGRNFNKLVRITKVTTKLCKLKAVFFPLNFLSFFPMLAKLTHHKKRDSVGCTSLLDFKSSKNFLSRNTNKL